ncbi:DUF4190 domain-containing protein [Kitasatospora sp. NPDC101801]|uniref:DUF4190 domain-containing protein n=1 Tax=Kitasatospora sp. NPDC101801 TaxID=3364103 RepID=UPI00382722EE
MSSESDPSSSSSSDSSAAWSPPSGSDGAPAPASAPTDSSPYVPPADANPYAPPADANPYAPPVAGANPYAAPADPYAPPTGPYAQTGAYPPPAAPGYPVGAPAAWGQGYWNGPPPPPQGTNGLAITSLVLGILGFGCFLWVLGLGFGIGALGQIRRRPQRGKGLAVAGIVLSCLWGLLIIGMAGVFVAKGDFDDIGSTTNVFSLEPGDCVQERTEEQGKVVQRFTVVSCSEPHHGEVFGSVPVPGYEGKGAAYPGETVLQDTISKGCVGRQYEYAADYVAVPRGVDVTTLYPDRASWRSGGKRFGLCVFESTEALTRTLRQDITAATAEQRGYLDASTELNQVVDQWPLDEPEDATPGVYQDWARRLIGAAETEKSRLNGVPWSDGTRAKVAPLQAELDQVIVHAEKIRKGTDPHLLADESMELEDLLRGPADTKLRDALKLPTSAPDLRPATV